ncbi:hypothetical protein M3Y98_00706900 [Aphelenchoides besseyi]|nr:hypothetical protein M3Y98_00706900 [Aphelenchoides besseyi]
MEAHSVVILSFSPFCCPTFCTGGLFRRRLRPTLRLLHTFTSLIRNVIISSAVSRKAEDNHRRDRVQCTGILESLLSQAEFTPSFIVQKLNNGRIIRMPSMETPSGNSEDWKADQSPTSALRHHDFSTNHKWSWIVSSVSSAIWDLKVVRYLLRRFYSWFHFRAPLRRSSIAVVRGAVQPYIQIPPKIKHDLQIGTVVHGTTTCIIEYHGEALNLVRGQRVEIIGRYRLPSSIIALCVSALPEHLTPKDPLLLLTSTPPRRRMLP